MSIADWIAIVAVFLTLVLNGGGWLIAIGRWGQIIDGLRESIGKLEAGQNRLEADLATKAPIDTFKELEHRTDDLERDMREVAEVKQALKSHAELTTAKFEAISQQSKAGFEAVASEIRAFDRLVSTQLDEIKHRLREPAPAKAN